MNSPSLLAGAFHQHAVSLFGRRIPSPRRRFFVRPVHSITAPPFLCSAGAFHRHAMVSAFSWRISSPRRILFVRPAHPIVMLPCHILAGASPRRATIA
jgi:hypothetical protein